MSSANEKFLRSLGWSVAETGGGCRALEFCQDPPQPMYYTVVTENLDLPEEPTCRECGHVMAANKQSPVVEIGLYKAEALNDYQWGSEEPCKYITVTWAQFVDRTAQQWHINMLERALSSGTEA
jgi:hypothetical protein